MLSVHLEILITDRQTTNYNGAMSISLSVVGEWVLYPEFLLTLLKTRQRKAEFIFVATNLQIGTEATPLLHVSCIQLYHRCKFLW